MRYLDLTATHHLLAEQEQQMHDTTDEAPSKTRITKERLRAWEACTTGFRWFVEKFPQGAEFAQVYAALVADKRQGDADWLVEHVLAELDDTVERVRQILMLAGADAETIRQRAKDGDAAATTGYRANAATTGDWANAATTGYRANAATTGDGANAATTGDGANAATTGDWANAATTGDGANAATTGHWAIAASLGIGARAKAGAGGAIMLAGRDDTGRLLHVFASMVGQNGIKPDTWYELDEAGKPIEVPGAPA